MKKFINGRWFPLVIVVVAEAVLLAFLYCNNFRITYAPDLENSWDAVSTFAAWAGVLMSFVAIMTAIWTPKKIADQQNKIALFEKKYEVYCELFKILSIGHQMDYPEPRLRFALLHEIEVIYEIDFATSQDINAQLVAALTRVRQSEYVIRQSMFLFDCLSETAVDKFIESFMDCIIFVIKDNRKVVNAEAQDIKEFIIASKDFEAKYLNGVEAELSLK